MVHKIPDSRQMLGSGLIRIEVYLYLFILLPATTIIFTDFCLEASQAFSSGLTH